MYSYCMILCISSDQSFSHVQLFATPWTAACLVSLWITNSWSLLKLMSIKLVIPSNHLILCRPLLLPISHVYIFIFILLKVKMKVFITVLSDSVSQWIVAHQASLSRGFFRQDTGVGCHFLFQGILST